MSTDFCDIYNYVTGSLRDLVKRSSFSDASRCRGQRGSGWVIKLSLWRHVQRQWWRQQQPIFTIFTEWSLSPRGVGVSAPTAPSLWVVHCWPPGQFWTHGESARVATTSRLAAWLPVVASLLSSSRQCLFLVSPITTINPANLTGTWRLSDFCHAALPTSPSLAV